jgi:uncharacterized protein (DUF4213/DUF364 family)
MMKLIDDLVYSVRSHEAPVADVRVGVSWTGVWGRACGLAKTYGIPVVHGNYTRDMGHLTEKTTLELAEYSRSWNLVEASIGVAAINSMIDCDDTTDGNAQEIILKEGKGRKVAVVGAFPFNPQLRKLAKEMWTFELDSAFLNPAEGVIIDTAAESIIPECEMVIITGSALINKSLERLLELSRSAKAYTVVLGPSTCMNRVLLDYGADLLGGVEVVKPEMVLRKLSQSGGMLDSKVCPGEIIPKVLMK